MESTVVERTSENQKETKGFCTLAPLALNPKKVLEDNKKPLCFPLQAPRKINSAKLWSQLSLDDPHFSSPHQNNQLDPMDFQHMVKTILRYQVTNFDPLDQNYSFRKCTHVEHSNLFGPEVICNQGVILVCTACMHIS